MTNYECEGYCAIAMKEAGVDGSTMLKVAANLWVLFDLLTEEQAEKEGNAVLDAVRDRYFG